MHYDPIRGFCPHICEVDYQMFTRLVFWFFQLATADAAAPILMINTSSDIVSHKDVPFGGNENKFLHCCPNFAEKCKFLVDFQWEKIMAQNGL